ncbi:hypothetical protein [Ruegeria sp. SCP11]|uniref:hypothetical protein n=1 Tax=Ruegeria sp. SCP11 TaxID=3141378 RepID=UPI00333DD617
MPSLQGLSLGDLPDPLAKSCSGSKLMQVLVFAVELALRDSMMATVDLTDPIDTLTT